MPQLSTEKLEFMVDKKVDISGGCRKSQAVVVEYPTVTQVATIAYIVISFVLNNSKQEQRQLQLGDLPVSFF